MKIDPAYRLRKLAYMVYGNAPRNWPQDLLDELRQEIDDYKRRNDDVQQGFRSRVAEGDG